MPSKPDVGTYTYPAPRTASARWRDNLSVGNVKVGVRFAEEAIRLSRQTPVAA